MLRQRVLRLAKIGYCIEMGKKEMDVNTCQHAKPDKMSDEDIMSEIDKVRNKHVIS
ncbi:hypothetical protein [Dyadobacter sp. CY312]|uniref:hypothetical protein n=1 Tax=Dyadobacter sp. CY312 TaxID=2907303 RepID=UPI001F1F29B6|nr:hypothetical protein [Dyadobacter sp. CY312]MCE7040794.1 hypothetical protein [Dyadobacter sp. CY312]